MSILLNAELNLEISIINRPRTIFDFKSFHGVSSKASRVSILTYLDSVGDTLIFDISDICISSLAAIVNAIDLQKYIDNKWQALKD